MFSNSPDIVTSNIEIPFGVPPAAASDGSWSDAFTTLSTGKVLMIFAILIIFGFNIFSGLAELTEMTNDVIGKPIRNLIRYLGLNIGEAAKDVVELSASGLKGGTDIIANTTTAGIDVVEKTITREPDNGGTRDAPIETALRDLQFNRDKGNEQGDEGGGELESGYCYIGSDRGFRACANLDESQKCMSGDIFPTKETCEHPGMRE